MAGLAQEIESFSTTLPSILILWSLATIVTCFAIWLIIKTIKRFADDESYIWDMCLKYPNDADLGKNIRKNAWKNRQDEKGEPYYKSKKLKQKYIE